MRIAETILCIVIGILLLMLLLDILPNAQATCEERHSADVCAYSLK
jgi:hypothetical protein